MKKISFKKYATIIILLNFFSAVITHLIVGLGLGTEDNPIYAYLIKNSGFLGMWLYTIISVTFGLFLIHNLEPYTKSSEDFKKGLIILENKDLKRGYFILYWGVLLMSIIDMINNTYQLSSILFHISLIGL